MGYGVPSRFFIDENDNIFEMVEKGLYRPVSAAELTVTVAWVREVQATIKALRKALKDSRVKPLIPTEEFVEIDGKWRRVHKCVMTTKCNYCGVEPGRLCRGPYPKMLTHARRRTDWNEARRQDKRIERLIKQNRRRTR